MEKKTEKYVINLDPAIAGAVGDLCPQESISCSLSKFIEIQLYAMEREYFNLINQDCIVSLPVEIVDTLKLFYPGLSFTDQVICAVRSLADLKGSDNYFGPDCLGNLAAYQEIADLQKYYATGGEYHEE